MVRRPQVPGRCLNSRLGSPKSINQSPMSQFSNWDPNSLIMTTIYLIRVKGLSQSIASLDKFRINLLIFLILDGSILTEFSKEMSHIKYLAQQLWQTQNIQVLSSFLYQTFRTQNNTPSLDIPSPGLCMHVSLLPICKCSCRDSQTKHFLSDLVPAPASCPATVT